MPVFSKRSIIEDTEASFGKVGNAMRLGGRLNSRVIPWLQTVGFSLIFNNTFKKRGKHND